MTTNQTKDKQASRWGSLLSGAVAGLESRLDGLLADDIEASAKSRAAEAPGAEKKALPPKDDAGQAPPSINGTTKGPSRPNRLQERLARAAMNSRTGSQAASEVNSPALAATVVTPGDTPRTSLGSRPSSDALKNSAQSAAVKAEESSSSRTATATDSATDQELESREAQARNGILSASALPINPARRSEDFASAAVPMVVVEESPTGPAAQNTTPEQPPVVDASSISTESDVSPKEAAELQAELAQLQLEKDESDRQRHDEVDTLLEKIDALQAKLQYHLKESVAAAREANAEARHGTAEQKLAAKDEQIALLMEEGLGLSKTEGRHLATIRTLSRKLAAEEKSGADLRRDLNRVKVSENTARSRLNRLEQIDKERSEKAAKTASAESQLVILKADSESKQSTIVTLRKRLDETERKMEALESRSQQSSLVADTRRIGDLEEELGNLKIEKQLVAARAKAEQQRLTKELESQKVEARAKELELRTEMSNLGARIEALQLRAEETSSEQTGESQAKLLRQIETAQTQYTLAAENWRTIEGSLNARLTAMEKERDETQKRESEARKKARELGLKCRKLEEEIDSGADKTSDLGRELAEHTALVKKLEDKLESSDQALQSAHAAFDQQRRTLESTFAARLDEERSRQKPGSHSVSQRSSKQTSSPPSAKRKTSTIDLVMSRKSSRGHTTTDALSFFDRPVPNRSSTLHPRTPDHVVSPTLSTTHRLSHNSLNNLQHNGLPPTPSITADAPDDDDAASSLDSTSARSAAAAATDVLSASTVHTGPSVQLVERMSSSIRRLEAEKAAHRDETARLTAQRDEARDQLVVLLREATARAADAALAERYEACLEMLGEREEEATELRGDLAEMKRIYKELVAKMGA